MITDLANLGASSNTAPYSNYTHIPNFRPSRFNHGRGLNGDMVSESYSPPSAIVRGTGADVGSLLEDASPPDKDTSVH